MSIWSTRPRLRWLVPALAGVLVVGGSATAGAITASAEPQLPPRSAAQLLVDLQTADVTGFSGTVVQRTELGLPALPTPAGQHGQEGSHLSSLLSGSHTLRVWYAGPDQFRLALLGTLGQSDIIRDGADLWTWQSSDNAASHRLLPPLGRPDQAPAFPGATPTTPRDAADAALAALDPTTEVTTDGTAEVAGRSAYELILTPRDGASLIEQVRLAIDAEHHLPLRVQVYGQGSDPAFEVRFTQISFERPDPEQFRFNPPPGATVTEADLLPAELVGPHAARPQVAIIGDGWTSVLAVRLPAGQTDMPALSALAPVSGAWGSGGLLSGSAFSVLVTDDGRILAGAVTSQRLTEAAADPAAALPQDEG